MRRLGSTLLGMAAASAAVGLLAGSASAQVFPPPMEPVITTPLAAMGVPGRPWTDSYPRGLSIDIAPAPTVQDPVVIRRVAPVETRTVRRRQATRR